MQVRRANKGAVGVDAEWYIRHTLLEDSLNGPYKVKHGTFTM